ncbi:MAG: Fe(3+) ABC transporter substrate-binding protein [Betaproteobacteria bacterium]|nr:Fe(3+) ABC transporter substrate-binding protein [Betaproteobacteria bacterium]
MTRLSRCIATALLALAIGTAWPAQAQDKVLNLYTARHYQTDEALYANFSKQTGIRINRIEGGEDALFERIKSEGANSPADVFITVDVGRLWRAEQAGIFAKIKSPLLESRIPAAYRNPEGQWFGFSARARVIAYNKNTVKPGELKEYEDLANPKWKGRICIRSSSHPYNLSLTGSMIAHLGEAKAEQWVRGLAANLARNPQGGDTDQLKAAAAGECDIAVANTYYFVRLMRSAKAEDKAVAQKLGVVFPNQQNRGVHMNISGGGVLRNAPHRDAAVRFLEYLASDQAQSYFANGNNEWPVAAGVRTNNPELESLGKFKADAINVGLLGKNQPLAQRIADRAGFK